MVVQVNGVPSCANKWLMTDKARNDWGFQGYITSDCGAVDNVLNTHHYTKTPEQTCKVCHAVPPRRPLQPLPPHTHN